jgi:hypothetical protein
MSPYQSANPSDPLGYDAKIGEDLAASGRAASGVELVADAMLHRLMAGRLLLTGAPGNQVEFGEDVRAWVGEALSEDAAQAKGPRLEEVLRRDPRIASVTVSVTASSEVSNYRLLIAVSATTISGEQIDRIVGVSQVSVAFLAQGI